MKYAELPDGKRIPFPDDMPEDKMRRAVRKELGLTHEDTLDALDLIATRLDDIHKQSKIKDPPLNLGPLLDSLKLLNKTMANVAAAMDLQSFQTEQLNKTLKAVETSNGQTSNALTKAFNPLSQTVEKLGQSVSKMSKDMNGALDHSTQAIQADLKTTMKAVLAVETVAKDMQIIALKVSEAIDAFDTVARMKKKAMRNPDGSWTLETSGMQKH